MVTFVLRELWSDREEERVDFLVSLSLLGRLLQCTVSPALNYCSVGTSTASDFCRMHNFCSAEGPAATSDNLSLCGFMVRPL